MVTKTKRVGDDEKADRPELPNFVNVRKYCVICKVGHLKAETRLN